MYKKHAKLTAEYDYLLDFVAGVRSCDEWQKMGLSSDYYYIDPDGQDTGVDAFEVSKIAH